MTERSAAGYVRTLLKFQRDGMTGTLAVGAEGVNTFVRFRDGKVVFADGGTLGETLGRLLVDDGIITAEQYGQAIQTMTESLVDNEQMRLGEVLVMLGFLSLEQVHDALAQQVQRKICRCLQWDKVTLEFDPDRARLEGIGHFPVTVEPLVVEAVRRFFEPERRDEILLPYLPHYVVLREHAASVSARYQLGNQEAKLVRAIDGTCTLGQVMDASVSEELDPGAVLTALLLADEIEAIAEPVRAEPAVSPQPSPAVASTGGAAAPRAPAPERRPRPPVQTTGRTPRSGEGMVPPPRGVSPAEAPAPEPPPTAATADPSGGQGARALPRRQRPTGRTGTTLGGVSGQPRAARPLPRRGRRTGQAGDPLSEEWETRDADGPYRHPGREEGPRDRPSWRDDEPRRQRPSWRGEEPRRQRPSWRGEEPRRQRPSWREEEPRRDRPSWREEEPRRHRPSWREEEPRRHRPSWREEEPRRQRPSWREEEPRRPERPHRPGEEPRRQRPSWHEDEPRGPERSQGRWQEPGRPHPHRPETTSHRRPVSRHDARRDVPRRAPDRRTGEPTARDGQERLDPLEMARRMRGTHRALGEWREDASEEEQRREEAELLGRPSDLPPESVPPKAESPAEKPVDERKLRLEAEQAYHRGLRLLFNQQFAQAHPELVRAADAVEDAVEYRLAAEWAEYRLCQDPDALLSKQPELKKLARAAARQDGALPFPPYVLAHIALVEGDEGLAHKLFRIAAHRMPKNVDAERHVRLLSARASARATKGTKGRRR